MVKQSRVTSGSVFGAPTQGNALLEPKASKKTLNVATRWRGLGRASAVFAVGLGAAFAAPREAKALPIFTDNSSYSLNQTFETGGLSTGSTTTSQPCSETTDPGCWTNQLVLLDIDQDGDFDLLEANGGGQFAPGLLEESVVYQNDGKAGFLDLAGPYVGSSLGSPHTQGRTVAAADIDGDGDIDMFQPGGYGTELDMLFVQTSTSVWADHASTNLPTAQKSHAAAAKFGDVDGDGDLDLLVADWGTGLATDTSRLLLYINDGTGVFTLAETEHDASAVTAGDLLPPAIPPSSTTGIYGVRITDVDFADIDGDYDLDILVNYRQGYSRIFLNDGHGKFADATNFSITGTTVTSNYPAKVGPYANTQEVCDIDEDGDLDIILDNAGTPATGAVSGGGANVTQVLLNDGTGKFVDGTASKIISEPIADDGVVRCGDINADGHYDIVVGSKTNTTEKLLLNDGTGKFSYVSDAFPVINVNPDITLALALGDINGDGKMDVITGQGEGAITSRLNHVYLGKGAADTTPPVIRKMQTPVPVVGSPTIFYMELRDAATNEAGQMVSLAVTYATRTSANLNKTTTRVATSIPNANDHAQTAWVGGDLFRVFIPATPAGTELKLTPTVTDHAGNVTTVPTMTFFALPPGTGTGGAGGTGGTAGGEAAGEAGVAGEAGEGGTGGVMEAGGTGGKAGSGSGGKAGSTPVVEGGAAGEPAGTAGTPATGSSGDGGCSISSVPVTKGRGAIMLGFGLAMLGLVRRRRNKK